MSFLPAAAVLYIAVVLVLPAVRLYRASGSFGIRAFDRATDKGARAISLGLVLCVVAVLISTIAYPAAWSTPPWITDLGWISMTLGTSLTITAQRQMGASWRVGIDSSPTTLVIANLYSIVRNPIFGGGVLTLVGLVTIMPSE